MSAGRPWRTRAASPGRYEADGAADLPWRFRTVCRRPEGSRGRSCRRMLVGYRYATVAGERTPCLRPRGEGELRPRSADRSPRVSCCPRPISPAWSPYAMSEAAPAAQPPGPRARPALLPTITDAYVCCTHSVRYSYVQAEQGALCGLPATVRPNTSPFVRAVPRVRGSVSQLASADYSSMPPASAPRPPPPGPAAAGCRQRSPGTLSGGPFTEPGMISSWLNTRSALRAVTTGLSCGVMPSRRFSDPSRLSARPWKARAITRSLWA
ncbi:hypothetical protein RKD49_000094 [Streptomyces glaucescens]